MAAYDYRCRACDTPFTVQRGMTDVAMGIRCPGGHDDVSRVWSAVALGGKVSSTASAPSAPAAGGCCGGGCCGS